MIVETAITLSTLYTWGKNIGGAIAIVIGGYKAYSWIKGIREEEFPKVNSGLADMNLGLTKVNESVDKQTHSIVTELKEMRQDFRTFYSPYLMPQMQHALPVRTRKATTRSKKPRKKAIDKTKKV